MQAVTIRNTGDDPLTIQVDGYRWSQEGNRDRTEPAENPPALPSIATFRPGGSQYAPAAALVALGRFGAPSAKGAEGNVPPI